MHPWEARPGGGRVGWRQLPWHRVRHSASKPSPSRRRHHEPHRQPVPPAPSLTWHIQSRLSRALCLWELAFLAWFSMPVLDTLCCRAARAAGEMQLPVGSALLRVAPQGSALLQAAMAEQGPAGSQWSLGTCSPHHKAQAPESIPSTGV